MDINRKKGIQPELRRHLVAGGAMTIPFVADPPVNAVEAEVEVAQSLIETVVVAADSGVVYFEGNEYTYDVAPTALDNEFEDCATLAALIDALPRWDADGTTDLVVTADLGGDHWNDRLLMVEIVEDETAGGNDAGTEAEATISEDAISGLAIGDTVEFDGNVFTMAAATSVADSEFQNPAGLEACLDDMADWGAVLGTTPDDIVITAATDDSGFNGREVVIKYRRLTEDGVNGTPGVLGAVLVDAAKLYVCIADNPTFSNQGWMQTPIAADFEAI